MIEWNVSIVDEFEMFMIIPKLTLNDGTEFSESLVMLLVNSANKVVDNGTSCCSAHFSLIILL